MFHVEVHDSAVRSAFAHMKAKGGNPAEYLPQIGAIIKESTRTRFSTSTGPQGQRWAPVLRGGQPLYNRGVHLRNPMMYRVSGNSVTVGVPYAWASVHQFGKTITAKAAKYLTFRIGKAWIRKRSVKIPARPFMGLSFQDRTDIIELLRRNLLPA